MEKKVKGFLISYRLVDKPDTEIKTTFVSHYSKEEALQLFKDFADASKMALLFCTIIKQKRTRQTARFFKKEYVEMQIENIKRIKERNLN